MKKIAIFSDIHGNLQALKSIIDDIDKENFDEVICLGDIIGVGPNPKECLDIIKDSKIKMVKGNHEIYQINKEIRKRLSKSEDEHRNWINSLLTEEELDYIKNIPMYYEELIDGYLFTFSHFFLNEEKNYFESLNILGTNRIYQIANEQESDYMFIGHSHDDFQIQNKSLVTCVGSSGCNFNNMTFYTVLEIDNGNVKIYKKELENDKKSFEKEVKKAEYPDKCRLINIFFGIKE